MGGLLKQNKQWKHFVFRKKKKNWFCTKNNGNWSITDQTAKGCQKGQRQDTGSEPSMIWPVIGLAGSRWCTSILCGGPNTKFLSSCSEGRACARFSTIIPQCRQMILNDEIAYFTVRWKTRKLVLSTAPITWDNTDKDSKNRKRSH